MRFFFSEPFPYIILSFYYLHCPGVCHSYFAGKRPTGESSCSHLCKTDDWQTLKTFSKQIINFLSQKISPLDILISSVLSSVVQHNALKYKYKYKWNTSTKHIYGYHLHSPPLFRTRHSNTSTNTSTSANKIKVQNTFFFYITCTLLLCSWQCTPTQSLPLDSPPGLTALLGTAGSPLRW